MDVVGHPSNADEFGTEILCLFHNYGVEFTLVLFND